MSDRGAPIYLVDDDVSVRESVGSLIRSAGFRAKTFASAQECLAGLQAEVPSCLVLDVQLPGLSGLDLQQQLAKADVQVPIIFLTGHGDIPMTVRAIKAGALEFLTKPCDGEDLLNAIRQGIARHQRARQQSRNLAQHSFDGTSVGTPDKARMPLAIRPRPPRRKSSDLGEEIRSEANFEGIVGRVQPSGRCCNSWKWWRQAIRPCSCWERRDRQGTYRECHPQSQPPAFQGLCEAELRRDSGRITGKRALWARKRRFYGCRCPTHRPIRDGRPRNGVPG